ncbi:N-succinylarginine dihydrolase [Endozoicomonas montiporae]|uniref:N-succinylarginine dihydrolase n=2 Tax=Endozoicomonas montiporae TaxID=1027273 RepID=A0A081N8U0_9GAMM|nr:N-succinylarginine dihydrolase [Endozoicomonas montiporae]AMO55225.1 succinylarginine dihydrolase [Endozoicomonas montiporae CL-33]KEQ14863.1 N-succinylarginine dihydrolase [Endozoicomonas montiporae]
MKSTEANFDGLVGPTHNYAGLSAGNIASTQHKNQTSNPRQAALQGLAKMKSLYDMGFVQGIIPPQLRPDIDTLRRLGFSGTDARILKTAASEAPELLSSCCSASGMWTANAATVSSGFDTQNGKVHFTPANLVSKFHRSIEPDTTARILKAIFRDERYFQHHPALPAVGVLGDEGAANHTRFCSEYHQSGVSFFVFGRYGFDASRPAPKRFPARQTIEASKAIARQHRLNEKSVVYAQQNPDVIDSGVFHNDVIAVGNQQLLLCHEKAFLNQANVYEELQHATAGQLQILEVPENRISVKTAVQTYLFNSQLICRNDGKMLMIVPSECENNSVVASYLNDLISADNPIEQTVAFDLRQSMNNGGGPACLRLRVVLNKQELQAVNQNCLMTDERYSQLTHWINKHYRDQLKDCDLADPALLTESREALDQLTQMLGLGSVYAFQKT